MWSDRCILRNRLEGNDMKEDLEKPVYAILEQMELAATCSECGNVSLAIWGGTGRCPHCDGKSQAEQA
jgi:hypothetical protein